MAIVVLYTIEFFSPEWRGVAATCLTFAWRIGGIISVQVVKMSGGSWRMALAAPLPMTVVSLALLAMMPESPQWLLISGRREEAKQIFERICASKHLWTPSPSNDSPSGGSVSDITDKHAPLQKGGASKTQQLRMSAWDGMKELVSKGMLPTTVVAVLISMISYAGNSSMWTWAPLMAEMIVGQGAVPLWVFASMEATGILGTVIAILSIDRYGRRALIMASFLLGGIACAHFATSPSVWTIIALLQLMGLQTAIMFSATGAFIAEVFPVALRGTANGVVLVFGRLSCMCVPILIGLVLDFSAPLALGIVSAFFFSGAVVAAFIKEEPTSESNSQAA